MLQDNATRSLNQNDNHPATTLRGNPISFLQADILQPDFAHLLRNTKLGPFQLLTSNPPYISRNEYADLPVSVREYEDPQALLGDPDGLPDSNGLTFYQHIAKLASNRDILAHDGLLVLEVGHTQRAAVMDILKAEGITSLRVWEDGQQKERVVVGRVG